MAKQNKRELLDNLRGMLREAFLLREQGVAYAKLTRVHGFVDGYMRVLMDTGIASQRDLLALVAETRAEALGPGTREVEAESAVGAGG
ncbi:MAG: hypothetical protein JW751_11725 [Polyangiaceae bacterium]|nr:hypothetical protein [Polyangiaceae bacterium]